MRKRLVVCALDVVCPFEELCTVLVSRDARMSLACESQFVFFDPPCLPRPVRSEKSSVWFWDERRFRAQCHCCRTWT